MAVSGTISTTRFNTLKVVDHAFRRCRLSAQQITAEMQQYAQESLYLLLSDLANPRCPSWCIEKQIYPFYAAQPIITLDVGTVEILNANYRVLQQLTGEVAVTDYTYTVDFSASDGNAGTVNTVGIKWLGAAGSLTFYVSDDALVWFEVGTQDKDASAGEWTWTDIEAAKPYTFFKIESPDALVYETVYLGTLPQEIPMGQLNRDQYVAQSNKQFTGRPLTYWFKRDRVQPKMYLWPAPNLAAEQCQLILWRHRHIMDVGTLAQDVEVPQRWMEAIINGLAERVGMETPAVDANLLPVLSQRAALSLQRAWDGDNDGSPIQINPGIRAYTR